MTRVPDLGRDELTEVQRRIHDEIAGARGLRTPRGPFAIWLRRPALADVANQLGNALRVGGGLDRRLFELAVLVVARHWGAQYEWFAHAPAATAAGLDEAVVEAIRVGAEPVLDDEEVVIYTATREVLERRTVSAETYQRVLDRFGLDLTIELFTVIGFYTMVAVVLNAFDVDVPVGRPPLPVWPHQAAGQTEATHAIAEQPWTPVRRVVTGHLADGSSSVWIDEPAHNHKGPDDGSLRSTLLWATAETPAGFTGTEDAGAWKLGTAPPRDGTRFCVIEWQPGAGGRTMHRTDSVDYAICLQGRITLVLDTTTVVLEPGDVVVQRGTAHDWRNDGAEPARLAVVLVDGLPKRDGSVAASHEAFSAEQTGDDDNS